MASLAWTSVLPCPSQQSSLAHRLPQAAKKPCGSSRGAAVIGNCSNLTSAVNRQRRFGSAGVKRAVVNVSAVATTAVDSHSMKVSEMFENLKKEGKVALIAYLTAGDPNIETTGKAMKILDTNGVDLIELGIPYSDPLADGPVIQAAANRALGVGTTVDSVLDLMREVGPDIKAPIVVFIYYNQLLRRGPETFIEQAKAAGAAGMVVPDLPLEETTKLRERTQAAGLQLILLTTPTTPKERMEAITEASQGFVYLVSLTGVTGARSNVESRVQSLLESLRESTKKPVCVGFGISTPEQALQIAQWGADGIIIGSAVVKLLGETGTPEQGLEAVKTFMCDVRRSISSQPLLQR